MKRYKKYILFLIIGVIFCGVLWSSSSSTDFGQLFETTNKKRMENKEIENSDIYKYMYQYPAKELGIKKSKLSYLKSPLDSQNNSFPLEQRTIKKEEAISDIHFLFQVLKYSYAGYSYFGGDKIWKKAKNNIIDAINSYEQEIDISELQQLLLEELAFVQDGHFTINFLSPLKRYHFYYSEKYEVQKDSDGYYIKLDNGNWYIESINNDSNIGFYIKPSMNKNGELCDYIGFLSTENNINALKVVVRAKEESKELFLALSRSNNQETSITKEDNDVYHYSEINKIPIFTIRSFDPNENLEEFMSSAKQAKNQDVIILDIRGNYGGQDIAPFTWFQNFTGQSPSTETTNIRLANLINNYVTKLAAKNIDYQSLSKEFKQQYKKELKIADCKENKWHITRETKKFVNNKTKIFVLMDNKVASSGENFIRYLDTLENVVFVGTNSSGIYLSLKSIQCTLPYSQITITYGDSLHIINDYVEGKGFEPDVWIGGSDSLERVVNFISRK